MTEKKVFVKQIEKLNSSKVKLFLEYNEDSIKEFENKIVNKYCKQASIAGFRPGKAPLQLVLKNYGDNIKKDLVSELLRYGLIDALEQTNFNPINEPNLFFSDFEKKENGRVFSFEANFEIIPEISLSNYKKIPITRVDLTVSEKEIEANINTLRENFAVLEPVETEKGENGLLGLVDMSYEVMNGSGKKEKIEKFLFEFGSQRLFKEIENALNEMKVGEERKVLVKIPNEYHNKELANKEVLYSCKLLEIKRKVLPPLDDSFASQVKEGWTFSDLKEQVHKSILTTKKEKAKREHRNQITDYLISQHSFEPPESMVEKEKERLLERIRQRMKKDGMDTPSLNDDDMKEIRKRAEQIVKGSLILREIAAKENIEIEKEVVNEKTDIAMSHLNEPLSESRKEKLREIVFDELHGQLLTEKVFDFLIENAEEVGDSPQS